MLKFFVYGFLTKVVRQKFISAFLRVATVGEMSRKNNNFLREFLRCLFKSGKSRGIMFSFRKASFKIKMINFELADGFYSFLLFTKLSQGH